MWCKITFLVLLNKAKDKGARVANYFNGSINDLHWNPRFIWAFSRFKLNWKDDFPPLIYELREGKYKVS